MFEASPIFFTFANELIFCYEKGSDFCCGFDGGYVWLL